jgi:hypothetical protein
MWPVWRHLYVSHVLYCPILCGGNGQGAFILFWECSTLRVIILDVKTYEIFSHFFYPWYHGTKFKNYGNLRVLLDVKTYEIFFSHFFWCYPVINSKIGQLKMPPPIDISLVKMVACCGESFCSVRLPPKYTWKFLTSLLRACLLFGWEVISTLIESDKH